MRDWSAKPGDDGLEPDHERFWGAMVCREILQRGFVFGPLLKQRRTFFTRPRNDDPPELVSAMHSLSRGTAAHVERRPPSRQFQGNPRGDGCSFTGCVMKNDLAARSRCQPVRLLPFKTRRANRVPFLAWAAVASAMHSLYPLAITHTFVASSRRCCTGSSTGGEAGCER